MTAAEIRTIRDALCEASTTKEHGLASACAVAALAEGADAMDALRQLVAAVEEAREASRVLCSGGPYDGRLGRANDEEDAALAGAMAVLGDAKPCP